jgi:hypothetical protein
MKSWRHRPQHSSSAVCRRRRRADAHFAATVAKRSELAEQALVGLRDIRAVHRTTLGQVDERLDRPQPLQGISH